jgi:c-di-GMP-binding flagellar brake protein YcgR
MVAGPRIVEEQGVVTEGGERRRETRLSTTGGPYRVSFQLRERHVSDARLANVSASGCALEVQMADARDMDVGSVLDDFFLLHPDLPCVPLTAVVVRLLGKVPGKTSGYVLAGVEFSMITPFVQHLIRAHVEAHAHAE